MSTSLIEILGLLFCLALAGVALGIRLAAVPEASRLIVPFSGGLLIGIALFWVLPEVATHSGWGQALGGILIGFAILWMIDRFLYPVCPACSHTHEHASCLNTLHGFAAPLILAASTHSFFDGWSVAISQEQASNDLKMAFVLGIGIHKVPEGLALGVLLLAATGSVRKAGLSSVAIQACMGLGAAAALLLSRYVGSDVFLSVAAGVFVYLGYHAIEGQSRNRGLGNIVMPALTGAAGAAVLRLVPGL